MRKLIALIALLGFMVFGTVVTAGTATATDSDCTPQAAYTSYYVVDSPDSLNAADASWVTTDPGQPYYQFNERTVTDSDAVAAQHYSLKGNSGIGKFDTPPTPAQDPSIWQANTTKEPHLNNSNITWVDGFGVGLHYASHRSEGKRDWFYFQPAVAAVTHQEFQYAQDHPEVTCQVQPNVATASVDVIGPNCHNKGYATFTAENATLSEASLPQSVGVHTVHFKADENADFDGGSDVLTLTYTIAGPTGDCPVPAVATADLVVTPPTCDHRGSVAVVNLQNAKLVGHLYNYPGTMTASFEANDGARFAGGKRVLDITYTVKGRLTGEKCSPNAPKPPVHHKPAPKPHNPVKHNAPRATVLPNAGMSDSSTNYVPFGIAGLMIASGAALLFRRRRA